MHPCVHFDSRGVVVRAYVKTDYFINVVGGRHNPENTASARLARKTNFACFLFFFFLAGSNSPLYYDYGIYIRFRRK